MPLPRIQRGDLWLVDLGYLGKVRPVVVISVPFRDNERTLCTVVPHTTSVIGTRFEVAVHHAALKTGAFDAQQTAAVQAIKFVRRLGALNAMQPQDIERVVAQLPSLKIESSTT